MSLTDPVDRQRARAAARQLFDAFCWEDTPQGATYWAGVHGHLVDLGRELAWLPGADDAP